MAANIPHKQTLNHSFSVYYAKLYGIEEAILIAHFQYWIEHNLALGINKIEGYTWTYQTRKSIAAHFTYLSEDQVKRVIESLIEKGVIIKKSFNKHKFDKTNWYAFKNQEMFTSGEIAQSTGEIAQSMAEIAQPIPYTKTHMNVCSVSDDGSVENMIVFQDKKGNETKVPETAIKEHLHEYEEILIEAVITDLKNYSEKITDIYKLSQSIAFNIGKKWYKNGGRKKKNKKSSSPPPISPIEQQKKELQKDITYISEACEDALNGSTDGTMFRKFLYNCKNKEIVLQHLREKFNDIEKIL